MKNVNQFGVAELNQEEALLITGGGWFDDVVNEVADAGIAFFQSFKATWNTYGRE